MNENIPQLFHYSTSKGFLGILQSNSLWLSNIHYLNDAEEYYHSLNLIKQVVETEYKGLSLANIEFTRKKIFDVYSFSLTSKKDLLSQWRGYCPFGGFSFCINLQQLTSILKLYYLKLYPVVYKEDEKKDFIKKTIIGFTPEDFERREDPHYQSKASGFGDPEWMVRNHKLLRRRILNYSALMKDESFQEEEEWRIITFDEYITIARGLQDIPPIPRGLEVKFREGLNTIIPYLQVPLTQNKNPIIFDEVVIGPTPHPELSEYSLNCLLKPINPNVKIALSNIPYRNW